MTQYLCIFRIHYVSLYNIVLLLTHASIALERSLYVLNEEITRNQPSLVESAHVTRFLIYSLQYTVVISNMARLPQFFLN